MDRVFSSLVNFVRAAPVAVDARAPGKVLEVSARIPE
jgi:hypothetical protein